MAEPRDTKHRGGNNEDLASTSNDTRVIAHDQSGRPAQPAPQGGKGTPSQAEGERETPETD